MWVVASTSTSTSTSTGWCDGDALRCARCSLTSKRQVGVVGGYRVTFDVKLRIIPFGFRNEFMPPAS